MLFFLIFFLINLSLSSLSLFLFHALCVSEVNNAILLDRGLLLLKTSESHEDVSVVNEETMMVKRLFLGGFSMRASDLSSLFRSFSNILGFAE